MIFFIAGQLFINYKHGVVFTPFFHYGMYSEVMKANDDYAVWEIEANNKKLQAADFSIQEWDKIILPLQYYAMIGICNGVYLSDTKRLLKNIGITSDDKKFLNTCNLGSFEKWYIKYLQEITGTEIKNISIHSRTYQLNNYRLEPTGRDTLLAQLCK